MYEPKNIPSLSEKIDPLSPLRFSVVHSRRYLGPNAPEADPMHIHNCVEIFLNISSDVSFLVNNNLYPVPVGDAVVSRPGDIHMGVFHKSALQEHVCIWLETDVRSPLLAFLQRPDFCPLFSFDTQTQHRLRETAFSLIDACGRQGSQLEKLSYLIEILSLFEEGRPPKRQEATVPVALQRILDDIHVDFARIRTVNDILAAHYVSSATLTRWFRKYLHSSPRDYLESVRLSSAARLLERDHSVTEACMLSGFSDCSHFIALFKRRFGQTPLSYKKKTAKT